MNCKEISEGLIAYFDGQADAHLREQMEDHWAGCSECRVRAEQFRAMWGVLDEMPAIEPTFGFDARVRQRVAAEPARRWFGWTIPQPRLALSAALLAVLAVWIVIGKPTHHTQPVTTKAVDPQSQQEDFNAIKNLDVLENYDVVTSMDALSELVPPNAPGTDGTQQN
jgi:anti-sigma factor RsiW